MALKGYKPSATLKSEAHTSAGLIVYLGEEIREGVRMGSVSTIGILENAKRIRDEASALIRIVERHMDSADREPERHPAEIYRGYSIRRVAGVYEVSGKRDPGKILKTFLSSRSAKEAIDRQHWKDEMGDADG